MDEFEEILEVYIRNNFTEETQEDILGAMSVFDFFDYHQAYQGMLDSILGKTQEDPNFVRDGLVCEVNRHLDIVINQHKIFLTSSATLFQRVQFARALGFLQKLIDYTGMIRILESLDPDEVRLAKIIAEISELDESVLMEIIEDVSVETIQSLKDFIYQKENAVVTDDALDRTVVEWIKDFEKVHGPNIASTLLASGVRPGGRFETYLGLIELPNILTGDRVQRAKNILSLIYLSQEGTNAALLTYRKNSYRILTDLNETSAVEVLILDLISKLIEYRKAKDEAARLSQKGA